MKSIRLSNILAGHPNLCLWKSSWWNSTSWPLSTQMDTKTCSTGTDWNGKIIVFCNNLLFRVMTKDNIALAALLQTKEACWEGGVPPDHKVFVLLSSFFALFVLFDCLSVCIKLLGGRGAPGSQGFLCYSSIVGFLLKCGFEEGRHANQVQSLQINQLTVCFMNEHMKDKHSQCELLRWVNSF